MKPARLEYSVGRDLIWRKQLPFGVDETGLLEQSVVRLAASTSSNTV